MLNGRQTIVRYINMYCLSIAVREFVSVYSKHYCTNRITHGVLCLRKMLDLFETLKSEYIFLATSAFSIPLDTIDNTGAL